MRPNYLIDENEVICKGANATISLLYHILETHGLRERNLFLHADNYIGQNKNNAVVHYFMRHVATGLQMSVQLSLENSSTCSANKALLIHATDGKILVKYYDWVEFLKQYYGAIPSISKHHIFIAEHDHANRIILREHSTAKQQI